MQSLLRLAFPPQCVGCHALVERDFALCGACWRETPFITGLICDTCGVPLPGDSSDQAEHCDECMTIARPWSRGRAAMTYHDKARQMVLALKHGYRLDLVRPAARWMQAAARDLITPETLILPVPVHRLRLLKRRYNQAALLSNEIGRVTGTETVPDLLYRVRNTKVQDGMSRDDRFANLSESIRFVPKKAARLKDREILLIDDVMTSGATLAATTEACHAAGASRVDVLVLARVAKDA